MNNDQPSQKSLDEVLLLVKKLGPEALASQFQDVALELARQEQQLEKQIIQFQQNSKQWESQRQQSVADIEEQSKQLADAWLLLESERRNLQFANGSPEHSTPSRDNTTPPTVAAEPQTQPTDLPASNNIRHSQTPSLTEQFRLLQRGKLTER